MCVYICQADRIPENCHILEIVGKIMFSDKGRMAVKIFRLKNTSRLVPRGKVFVKALSHKKSGRSF